jgi:hypothetical protein
MKRWVAFVALAATISACSASSGGTALASPSPNAPSPSQSSSPGGLSFKLNGIDTTATGTATLIVQPANVTIDLVISGLQANSKHVSHIHLGGCQQRGGIAIFLSDVPADGQGHADTRTTISATYPSATGTWYVVVHAGLDMQGTNATYLLCGNLFA